MKNQNGITLIALVITIIVLLILVGVAIAMLSGENGILNQASKSGYQTAIATAKEEISTKASEYIAAYYEYKYADNTSTTATIASGWADPVAAVNAAIDAVTTETSQKDSVTIEYTTKATSGTTDGTVTITYKTDTAKKTTGTVNKDTGLITWVDAY